MDDTLKFLKSVFAVEPGGGSHATLPQHTLDAIDSGIINLPLPMMQSQQGAEVLAELVSSVCRSGPSSIANLDALIKPEGSRRSMVSCEGLVERLLNSGVDPWMATADGESPWDIAVTRGWEFACLRFIAHPRAPKGEALGDGCSDGAPWISCAARHDMRAVLKALLIHTTQPSALDKKGSTALHQACSVAGVEMLLKAGIDTNIEDNNNRQAEQAWTQMVRANDLASNEYQKM